MLINKIKMVPRSLGKARYSGSFPIRDLILYGTRNKRLEITNILKKNTYNCSFNIISKLGDTISGEVRVTPQTYSGDYSAANIFKENTSSYYCYGINGNTVEEPSIIIEFNEGLDITAMEFAYPSGQSDNYADHWDIYLNDQDFATVKDVNLNEQTYGSVLRANLKMKLFKKLDGTTKYLYIQTNP